MLDAADIDEIDEKRIDFGKDSIFPAHISRLLFAKAKKNRHAKVIFQDE